MVRSSRASAAPSAATSSAEGRRSSGRSARVPLRFRLSESPDSPERTPSAARSSDTKARRKRASGGSSASTKAKSTPKKTASAGGGSGTQATKSTPKKNNSTGAESGTPATRSTPKKTTSSGAGGGTPGTPARRRLLSGDRETTSESPAKPKAPPPPIQYDPADYSHDGANLDWDDDDEVSTKYEPAHFLRCHSARGDPSDVHTDLWDCKFMPGGGGGDVGDVVATCGGNSVCLIQVQTGKLLKKFSHPDISERLSALAWSRLRLSEIGARRIAILAVGGTGRVYLLHPDNLTWYATFSPGPAGRCEVTALVFHPRRSRWLLAATGDGAVSLWDVGVPAPPLYKVEPFQLLRLETATPPLALAVHASAELLLAGCEGGLSGWLMTLDVVRGERQPREVRYKLPEPPAGASEGDEEFVDAITLLGTEKVAVKCASCGCVYVWSLSDLEPPQEGGRAPIRVDLIPAPCRVLRWSDTTESYLGLGAGTNLLAAGDDKGAIWMWNWRDSSASSGEPVNTLCWPRPQDEELSRARKVPLHRFPILMNRVCLSEDEQYLVGVTHNNMVCVWKRAEEDGESDREMEVD
ncbi:leucine-rich repeat and WD repeat-containing protein 1-like isoform X1 [Amphibalanus amphitrite]|uniref:leucine-rich repeat and WD repeat-containing protein 1-like isoform X1 n=1 Tax=Amphibalanus amphitrite TaxID=1232801 RepID=UPI001C91A408|nr:leucine-rich repeat and WD repeat-containing protein 1-like isoform X1 [Amphibalanus amphitrite]